MGLKSESILKLVETGATPVSGDGMWTTLGNGDPEVLLDRGPEEREVSVPEQPP